MRSPLTANWSSNEEVGVNRLAYGAKAVDRPGPWLSPGATSCVLPNARAHQACTSAQASRSPRVNKGIAWSLPSGPWHSVRAAPARIFGSGSFKAFMIIGRMVAPRERNSRSTVPVNSSEAPSARSNCETDGVGPVPPPPLPGPIEFAAQNESNPQAANTAHQRSKWRLLSRFIARVRPPLACSSFSTRL